MRKDEDFKPVMDKDGNPMKNENGDTVYSNLEKVCEGLPEWNDMLWCTFCRKPITTMKDIHFWRWDTGKELWFKVFHESCMYNGGIKTPEDYDPESECPSERPMESQS